MYAYLKSLLALKSDRRAVTALEYGLIAALIAGVLITGVASFGTDLKTTFTHLGSVLNTESGKVNP